MTAPQQRRVQAWLALVCTAALVALLVVILWNNVGALVVSLVGFAITAVGGWWVVARPMPWRAIGIALAVAGLGIILLALVDAVLDAEQVFLRLGACVALTVGAVLSGRAALRRSGDDRSVPPVTTFTPLRPVLLCNPWSGGGKVERFGLVDLAGQLGVEIVMLDHGLDLEQLARDAIARGADCLGMAGGDGSQALVASIAIEHGLPFVCVSAGTRNHFALDLGLDRDDPRDSMRAFVDGVERRVDYATVNGRLFVNNVSLGVYATIVQEDDYRDAKAATTASLLPRMLGPDAERFDLQFTDPDGLEVDGAILILVSNNPYVMGASLDNFQRRRLDQGQLGVVALDATGAADAAALATAAVAGLRSRSRAWHEFTATEFEIRSRSGSAFAGVDGEALDMPTPLLFEIHAGGLHLLVPADNLEAAERRRARDIHVASLMAVALGHDRGDRNL